MRCNAITSGGARCKLEATHGSYCWSHAPETADERRRRARRGGRSGGRGRSGSGASPELKRIKNLLKTLTDRVIGAEDNEALSPSAGAVAAQLINTCLRAIEQERKLQETEELEARIAALESERKDKRGESKWAN